MIDTSQYETDVVVTKTDDYGNIQQIDFIDINGNCVDSCKYRAKKQKTKIIRDLTNEQ